MHFPYARNPFTVFTIILFSDLSYTWISVRSSEPNGSKYSCFTCGEEITLAIPLERKNKENASTLTEYLLSCRWVSVNVWNEWWHEITYLSLHDYTNEMCNLRNGLSWMNFIKSYKILRGLSYPLLALLHSS